VCNGSGNATVDEEAEYQSAKPYGIRYKVFAGRDQRVTTKEAWFKSAEAMERGAAKIEALGNFYEIDGYHYPSTNDSLEEEAGAPLTYEDIVAAWKQVFPHSSVGVAKAFGGGYSFKFRLAKDKTEVPSGIMENDPLHYTALLDTDGTWQEYNGSMFVKPPAGSNLVYSSVKLRKKNIKGATADRILRRFKEVHNFVAANASNMKNPMFDVGQKLGIVAEGWKDKAKKVAAGAMIAGTLASPAHARSHDRNVDERPAVAQKNGWASDRMPAASADRTAAIRASDNKKKEIKENATGGATGAGSVAVSFGNGKDMGGFSKKDVNKKLSGYGNMLTKGGKVAAPKATKMNEDNEIDSYQRPSRVKMQQIPAAPYKRSKMQELCAAKGIEKGDTIFIKELKNGKDDYVHGVFIRPGNTKMIVHNYETGETEACDPGTLYTKEGFKFVPIMGVKK
jgi:hypothetical protein